MSEKISSSTWGLPDNALFSRMRDVYRRFSEKRESLGLSNPGTVENIAREVQRDVFLNNSMFTGFRVDLTKTFSVTPMFQTSHAFSMGSQGIPPYTFISSFGTPRVFMQGTVDNDGQLAARTNYRWNDTFVTKTQTQIAPGPGQSMIQIDNDYTGKDFTASIKSLNPSIIEGGLTGIFIGSYLQSVTPGLALGLEAVWQRQAMATGPDALVSYVAKYRGSDWIASAQLQAAQGALNTSYWRRLTDKVEAGADLSLQMQPGLSPRGGLMGQGPRKEGVATVGAKYDFRASSFRAQIDSTGKLSALLEKRVLPFMQVTFAGELDQVKQQAKVGLGVTVDVPNEDIMDQQEKALNANIPSPPY